MCTVIGMFRSLLSRRIDMAVQATPVMLRWLEQCAPDVMQAYRAARRGLFTRQLPALVVLAAVAFPVKLFRWLPAGHPALVALYLVGLLILAWPPYPARFAWVAWRAAPAERRYGVRLRLLAGVLFVCIAVYAAGFAALVGFFAFALVR